MIHRSLAPQSIKDGDHFISDNVEYVATSPACALDKKVIVWALRVGSETEGVVAFFRTDLVEVIRES